MTNFTSIKLTVPESIPISGIQCEYNGTGPMNSTCFNDRDEKLVQIFIFLICTLGMLGNGLVIWLLGFCIKKNPFTTYILNLSVADLGFLITDWIIFNPVSPMCTNALLRNLIHFTYTAGQYFLTAISMDRCVSIFFPFWYHSHRPKHLSAIVSALIWVISFLPPNIAFMVYMSRIETYCKITRYQFSVNGFLCLPLMFISSLLLFSKVCSKLEQRKQRKPLVMILATVLCFLIFSFPVNATFISRYLFHIEINIIAFSAHLCACLNSSINPIIYGLIGRPRNGCSMKNVKTMLQGLFGGEELSVQPAEIGEITLE